MRRFRKLGVMLGSHDSGVANIKVLQADVASLRGSVVQMCGQQERLLAEIRAQKRDGSSPEWRSAGAGPPPPTGSACRRGSSCSRISGLEDHP